MRHSLGLPAIVRYHGGIFCQVEEIVQKKKVGGGACGFRKQVDINVVALLKCAPDTAMRVA